jgi:hypothetical protein
LVRLFKEKWFLMTYASARRGPAQDRHLQNQADDDLAFYAPQRAGTTTTMQKRG